MMRPQNEYINEVYSLDRKHYGSVT